MAGVGTPAGVSNRIGMNAQQQDRPEVDTDRIRALAERAARVQDILGDLEVALLPPGDSRALKVLGELKAAGREFRDEAMRDPR